MKEILEKFNKLFLDKKYSELILLIEKSIKLKPPRILNILAVTRLLNSRDKNSFILAINEFEEAYLKEPDTQVGFEGLKNYINAVVDFYEFHDVNDKSIDFKILFKNALKYFVKAEKFFGYESKLFIAMVRIYKRLNQLDKILYCYKKLSDNNDLDSDTLSSWIFYNSYGYGWQQKDYLFYSKLLNNYLTKYSSDELCQFTSQNNTKIKVGFLSSHFHKYHSVAYFLRTILENYDASKFEIYLYLNHKIEDQGTEHFKNLVKKFINVSSLNDLEAINLIRKDNLNIIFDLEGITSTNRISLFKNRIAMKQISWLGYLNTLGIDEMDYIMVDPNLIFQGEQNLYSEKVIYLPKIWSCHPGFQFKRIENPPPYQKNKFITFGSFNNFIKINDKVVDVWCEILKNLDNSKLILKSSSKGEKDRLEKIFIKNSVNDFVVFVDATKKFKDHLDLYKKIDIALDTFPYNGVTTSFEAIWMGVPVLTMKGFNFTSRCGESINKNIGLEQLIAKNEKDYILKATNLANDKIDLLKLRKKVFEEALKSPLFNVRQFSKDFFNSLESLT